MARNSLNRVNSSIAQNVVSVTDFGAVGDGFTDLCQDDADDAQIGSDGSGGAWNTAHLRLGPYHLWVDSTGDLRIKSSAPANDTDGTVVGTQS